jgi:hypothetical protein
MMRFGLAVFACLFCLTLGCSKMVEEPKTNKIEQAKVEAEVKKRAAIEKTQPAVEKPVKVVTVTCKTRPSAKKDPNAPEPNMNRDWYVGIDGQLGPRHDGIGMIAFSPQWQPYRIRGQGRFEILSYSRCNDMGLRVCRGM